MWRPKPGRDGTESGCVEWKGQILMRSTTAVRLRPTVILGPGEFCQILQGLQRSDL